MQTDFEGQIPLQNYIARDAKYFNDWTLNANQILFNQQIRLSGGEMYFAVERLMSVQTGAFRVSLYTSSSDRYNFNGNPQGTTDRVRSECFFGTASRPAIPTVPIIIPGSAYIGLDLEDVSGAQNTLHIVLEGRRLYPK